MTDRNKETIPPMVVKEEDDAPIDPSAPTNDPVIRRKNTLAFVAMLRHELIDNVQKVVDFAYGLGAEIGEDIMPLIPSWSIGVMFTSDDESCERYKPIFPPREFWHESPARVLDHLARDIDNPERQAFWLGKFAPDLAQRREGVQPIGFVVSLSAKGWSAGSAEEMGSILKEIQSARSTDRAPDTALPFMATTCNMAILAEFDTGNVSTMMIDENGIMQSVTRVMEASSDADGDADVALSLSEAAQAFGRLLRSGGKG